MKLIDKATDWAVRIAGARDAIAELHAHERQLLDEHAAAVKARGEIAHACAPREEIIATAERLVDEAAARWAKDRGIGLVMALGPGFKLQHDGTLEAQPPRFPDWLRFEKLGGLDLIGLVPALVKARLREVLAGVEYAAGPPGAERRARLEEADARIAQLEAQHAALVDDAATYDPPIALALLPAVRERREADARRREQEAAADAARREREAAINRRHDQAAGRHAALSPYLTAPRPRDLA